jgi:FkbM family methyltransferase
MFNLDQYIIDNGQGDHINIKGYCSLPWHETPAYRWIFKEPFLDIWGKRLFGIEEHDEGPYEVDNVRLSPEDIVIDAGANIGLFSALACSLGCTVYAFEPFEKNIRLLNRMKELNPEFKLTVCPYALGDYNGLARLYSIGDDLGGGTVQDDINENNKRREKREITSVLVHIITLDRFVQINKIDNISFIKADIEGAEISMLKGAAKTLCDLRPKLSLCSYHRVTDRESLGILIGEFNPGYTIVRGKKKIYAF